MNPFVTSIKPNADSIPGFYEPGIDIKLSPISRRLSQLIHTTKIEKIKEDQAIIIHNALSHDNCVQLIDFMNQSNNFEDVGVQGIIDKKDTRIVSKRTSFWTSKVAQQIWERIRPFLNCKISNKMHYTPIAMSPLLRFMQYQKGGQHYAHYDASYIYPITNPITTQCTLKSVVIYLTTNNGAATRFIRDEQKKNSINERNYMHWDRPVKDEEIIGKSECIEGNILIFDHRLCHDVEQYLGNEKCIIIRGDIIYTT